MQKRKALLLIFTVFFTCASLNFNAFALSEKQKKQIIRNCEPVKETLRNLQHSDSYSRIYLGSVYEKIFGNYMVPFNNRVMKNGIIDDELTENQEEFVKTRTKFNADFVTYSKSLESLININCETNPDDFYDQLEQVRIDRGIINQDVERMAEIIENHKKLVYNLEINL